MGLDQTLSLYAREDATDILELQESGHRGYTLDPIREHDFRNFTALHNYAVKVAGTDAIEREYVVFDINDLFTKLFTDNGTPLSQGKIASNLDFEDEWRSLSGHLLEHHDRCVDTLTTWVQDAHAAAGELDDAQILYLAQY